MPKSSETPPGPTLPASAREAIGRKLRDSLEQIVAERVPDRFLQLLDDLERKSSAESSPGPADEGRSEEAEVR